MSEKDINTPENTDLLAEINEWQNKDEFNEARQAAARIFNQEAQQIQTSPLIEGSERRKPTRRQVATAAALAGAAAAGIVGLNHLEGGNSETYGDLSPSIESITLSDGANIRTDASVGDDVLGPNIALQLDAPVKIDVNHDVRIIGDTKEGTWYGIPIDEVAKELPAIKDKHDNDGVVWVNKKAVDSIESSSN